MRLERCINYAEKLAALPLLVDDVRGRLSPADSGLLTTDALYMILESGWGTLREAGNGVAHGRTIPETYMSFDVLKGGLSGTTAALFSNIYQFARKL
jgi:hypothetical protein